MQSVKKIVAIMAAVLGLAISAMADTQEVGGITWTYMVSNGEASIGERGHFAISNSTTGAITIPSSLGGYPVTRIGGSAFYGCSKLTSVTIPDSVTSIGGSAFSECSALTDVILPADTIIATPWMSASSVASSPWDDKCWSELVRIAQKSMNGTLGGNPRYDLSNSAGDRRIASVTVSADTALDDFVLTSGKVYDSVLRVVNTANEAVTLTLPQGYVYETIAGTSPLRIPANSINLLTITRTAENTFLVSRQKLEVVQ